MLTNHRDFINEEMSILGTHMSEIEISNQRLLKVTHIPTGLSGKINWHDRISRRGKSANMREHYTYVAIFTFSEPIVYSEDEVPDAEGIFLFENGRAEAPQLVGRFSTETARSNWVRAQFSFDRDQ